MPKLNVGLNGTAVSEALFYHQCRIRWAGWKHRVDFRRGVKHGVSEIFQDLLAFHLRLCLGKQVDVVLEEKKGKLRPDILIKRVGKSVGIVEVKTTIGWARPDNKHEDRFWKMNERIVKLSEAFEVPPENVIYVFEDHSNVSTKFSDCYWNKKGKCRALPRPTEKPLDVIYPLFNKPDPYYWPEWKGFDKDSSCPPFDEQEVFRRAPISIVTPLEEVVQRILEME